MTISDETEDDGLDPIRAELLAAAVSPNLVPFVREMTARGYAISSQIAALGLVAGVQAGSIANGYLMARAQGLSRAEAQQLRATARLLAIAKFLGPEAPEPLQRETQVEPFGFERDL